MVRDNTSPHGTNFTVSIEAAEGVTTGISAYDRAHTIRTAVRPDASARDLSQPGHIFPLQAQPGGVLNRAGHTEAASDLALLAGLEPAGVLVEILNADGSMARRPELEVFAREHGLKIGSIDDLIRHRLATEHTVERVRRARRSTPSSARSALHAYRDRLSHALHFALVRGEADAATPTLVRVHVRNPLADVLHWRRADFGPAVGDVLRAIAREGRGALVLLGEAQDADALLARLREQPDAPPAAAGRAGRMAPHGAGAQILADLGLGKLRVLGTPRRAGRPGRVRAGSRRVPRAAARRINRAAPAGAKLARPSTSESRPCRHYEGDLRARDGARFAILASRWNPRIIDALVAGARRPSPTTASPTSAVDVVRVPGAWEMPLAAARLAAARRARRRSSRWVASCAATRAITSMSPTAAPRA